MRLALTTLLTTAAVAAGCLTGAAHAGHAGKGASPYDERALPKEQQENYRVFTRVCSGCHKPEKVLRHHVATPREWEKIVDRMVRMNGARLSQDERTRVLSFLIYAAETPEKDR